MLVQPRAYVFGQTVKNLRIDVVQGKHIFVPLNGPALDISLDPTVEFLRVFCDTSSDGKSFDKYQLKAALMILSALSMRCSLRLGRLGCSGSVGEDGEPILIDAEFAISPPEAGAAKCSAGKALRLSVPRNSGCGDGSTAGRLSGVLHEKRP